MSPEKKIMKVPRRALQQATLARLSSIHYASNVRIRPGQKLGARAKFAAVFGVPELEKDAERGKCGKKYKNKI